MHLIGSYCALTLFVATFHSGSARGLPLWLRSTGGAPIGGAFPDRVETANTFLQREAQRQSHEQADAIHPLEYSDQSAIQYS